jgi:TPP-dependent 2-oxoacid decarboxylase
MTAGEIGNYARSGSNAIIILVNNNGYLIERYLSPIPDSGEAAALAAIASCLAKIVATFFFAGTSQHCWRS